MARSDSDGIKKDSPIELPDGRLICRPHGRVVCGRCCVDYSFMDEILEDDEERVERADREIYQLLSPEARAEIDARWGPPPGTRAAAQDSDGDSDGHAMNVDGDSDSDYGGHGIRPMRRGTGRVFPTTFTPPSATSTPAELFPRGIGREALPNVYRFIRSNNRRQFLIYADGACLNNGQANPKAGWAFAFRPEADRPAGITSSRLENKGPFGDAAPQTSNRAELRAILGALRYRHWPGEGCTTLVFATDAEYVAKGATQWVRSWIRNGWRTSTGAEVKNKDLWELLLGEVERFDSLGLKIQFWRIPRVLNFAADHAAKQAAMGEDVDEFRHFMGMLV